MPSERDPGVSLMLAYQRGDETAFDRLVERRSGFGNASVPTSISYYAGAVAIMFLLFSAMNGGLSLLQEKQNGLLARVSTGPARARPVIDGKFAFLVLQGMAQAAVIFVVAWLGFGLDLSLIHI